MELPDLQMDFETYSDEELILRAFECVQKALDLDPVATYLDKLGAIRLYDNLAVQFGGDEELMRHWVRTGNKHLGFTPYLCVHNPALLTEMNEYLESFRHR